MLFVAGLVLVSFVACERVDRSDTTAEPPPAPSAVGGGPTERVYSDESSAMNVLAAARCHHARKCGYADAGCENEAASIHGPQVAACQRGVRATALHDCASLVRSAMCPAAKALPETCLASVLCRDQ
jgi:hypothetical protein